MTLRSTQIVRGTLTASNEPAFWLLASRNMPIWDVALISVVSLLIGGLVGMRLTHILSKRGVGVVESAASNEGEEGDPDDPQSASDHPVRNAVSASTPSKLLSDEGEVIKLLMLNDGHVRQHQITKETGWSKSKVSRTVSSMCEDGLIEKTASGRENVITLSEYGPSESAESGRQHS